MALAPRVLTHNGRLKLAALALAVVLWAMVQVAEPRTPERIPAVPVEVAVGDTAWTVSGAPLPATVEVLVRGPIGEILRVAREGTVVRVPIAAVGSTDTLVNLRSEWVRLASGSGLTVEGISPGSVRLAFEPARARVVPVSMRVRGVLSAHLALAGPIGLNPQVVKIRGAADQVAGVDSVPLKALDLSNVSESGIYRVPVDSTALDGLSVTPSHANLGIRVEEAVERVLSGVPVQALAEDGEQDVLVDPESVTVTLRGARTLVNAVQPGSLRPVVSSEFLRDMLPGEERRVPLRLEGVPHLVEGSLEVETVTVRRAADAPGYGGPVP